MEKFWIIPISLFLIITLIFWRITYGHFKKVYGEQMWKKWGTRTFYWQGAIFVGTGGTFLILYLLKWMNVLIFKNLKNRKRRFTSGQSENRTETLRAWLGTEESGACNGSVKSE